MIHPVKIIRTVALVGLVAALVYGGAHAQSFWGRRDANVGSSETVAGDHFAFGPLVTISGTVNGDVYAVGGQIVVDGTVNGDLLISGGRVSLSGTVAQDVRLVGGQINISGRVQKNLTILGGNVELSRGASIEGSVVAGAGNIHVAAPIKGPVKIAAGSLIISNRTDSKIHAAVGSMRITSNAEILGDLNYYSRHEAEVEQGAQIKGKLIKNPPPHFPRPSPERIFIFFAGLGFFWLVTGFTSTLILGLLSLRFLPSYHERAVGILKNRPWASLGLGFVAVVVIPASCAILFALVLTIPLAVILSAGFGILLFWGRIVFISRFGEAIMGPKKGWAFLLGLVLYYVLGFIPVIGWIFVLFVILSGLGAELIARKQLYVEARSRQLL